ncbi:MAG: iron complex transport system permease [Beijerinckiaceae bacterium]|nr:MAG: iron complex transport system permease [Beijerinckiaceae bacterium]
MALADALVAAGSRQSRRVATTTLLVAFLVAASLVGLGVGQFPIAPSRVIAILGQAITDPAAPLAVDARILLLVRLPRLVLAILAGAGLAICGGALQCVFRNPLVAPQILGISPGAAFGGALAIFLGISGVGLLGLSFACGLGALVLVGWIARIDGRTETVTVLLGGLVVGSLFSALVSLIQFVADPNGSLPAIVYWLMGSFASATWEQAGLAAPGLVTGSSVLLALRFRLNILSLDENEARSLGAHPERERWLVFGLVAIVVASSVAVSGIIGWVGLIIPHISRLIVGPDQRVALPVTALIGASFLVVTDTIARTATTAEIPLGVLTAIVGAPIFALLLRRHFREREA